MELLKTKRDWQKWCKAHDLLTKSDIANMITASPTEYPCFAYAIVKSWNDQDEHAVYLYPADIERMEHELARADLIKPSDRPRGKIHDADQAGDTLKLSRTQKVIMDAISHREFESPSDIGLRAGIDNSGGTAASLRVLVRKGLVEQKKIGQQGRWELFGYRARWAEGRNA